ncbi:MAG: TldD/PmbA family protein [Clostridia bacterium]|nr:TldD/PmbA family protein [Clostridia bacterium]
MDRAGFIRELLDRGVRRGVAAEVCTEDGASFEVQVKDGEVLQYNVSDGMGLGLRVLKDGRTGTASTQILDEEALDQLLDGAIENAELVESKDEQFMFPGSDSYPALDLYNPEIDAIPAAEKIDMAMRLEKLALSQDPRVTQIEDCAVFSTTSARGMVNTLGLDVSSKASLLGGYVSVVARDGDQVNTGMKVFFTMDPKSVDLEAVAQAAVREAVDGLGGTPVASGKYRVLLRRNVAGTLLSTFSGIFSADNAQRGLSRLAGQEGEQIAADCVTIMDDPHRPGSASSAPFDGEGVATVVKAVVENGRLNTLLHDLKTAHKQGVATTANGARSSYAAPVGIAPTNFYFAPSGDDFDAMLARTGDGLLITELQGMHAGANAITGDFSLAAKGFVVEGGKVGRAVSQITVAGNFYQLLKDIEAVGADLEFRVPGVSCFGSPSLLVRELSVAGE